jgi:chromosome segregation ATPase
LIEVNVVGITMSEKENFIKKAESELQQLEGELRQLEAKINELSRAIKADKTTADKIEMSRQKHIDAFKKHGEARKTLEDMKPEGMTGWAELKEEVENAIHEIREYLRQAHEQDFKMWWPL